LHPLYVYKGNYLSYQEKLGKVSVIIETIERRQKKTATAATKLPLIQNEQPVISMVMTQLYL